MIQSRNFSLFEISICIFELIPSLCLLLSYKKQAQFSIWSTKQFLILSHNVETKNYETDVYAWLDGNERDWVRYDRTPFKMKEGKKVQILFDWMKSTQYVYFLLIVFFQVFPFFIHTRWLNFVYNEHHVRKEAMV